MRKHSHFQLLADIVTNIEAAQAYVSAHSLEEFSADGTRIDAVRACVHDASQAAHRLQNDAPDVMRTIEMRNPDAFLGELRDFSRVSRPDYEIIEAGRIWEDLQPQGKLAQIADVMRGELPLAQTRQPEKVAALLDRSMVFATSMRHRIVDFGGFATVTGNLVWRKELPDTQGAITLVDVGKGVYQRAHVTNANEITIGDSVTLKSSENGLEMSRNEKSQSNRLGRRMT
jgi:uncharacterized protein with HEPN domain